VSASKILAITGSAGGLGQELARRFLADGAAAVVLADIDAGALERQVDALADAADRVLGVVTDVTDRASVHAMVDATVVRFGRLDVLVNNAGIAFASARIHSTGSDVWSRAFDVNVMGVVHGIAAAVPVMRANGGGAIINTASVAGITAWPASGPYCVTKAAVIHLTKVAALDYASDSIRVNCVCPGVFAEGMHDTTPPEVLELLSSWHPMGVGHAADVAGAFLYLASDAARWTTGTALVVDGGHALP
jgi:3-oxoacyl-[acyl-carrier protein] reductase